MMQPVSKVNEVKLIAPEVWKDIPGFEGKYQASWHGMIKSINYNHKGVERIMKLYLTKYGYLTANLWKDGKQRPYFVHQLVALAFIPNPDGLPFVDHCNTCKIDNSVPNLRWVTRLVNSRNPISRFHCSVSAKKRYLTMEHPMKGKNHTEESRNKMSQSQKGKIVSNETREKLSVALKGRKRTAESIAKTAEARKKPILQYTKNGEFVKEWPSAADAAKNGYNGSHISAACNGNRRFANGYVWRFK